MSAAAVAALGDEVPIITLEQYRSEVQLPFIVDLMVDNLSEPYSVFTYRYFLNNWPHLSFLAMTPDRKCVGTIVCKAERDRHGHNRGYIAMLAVDQTFRKRKIGSRLVETAIKAMVQAGVDLVVLEAEVTNLGAIALYEKLNFVRDQRLLKYYLSGNDAFRLKLWIKDPAADYDQEAEKLEGAPPQPQEAVGAAGVA